MYTGPVLAFKTGFLPLCKSQFVHPSLDNTPELLFLVGFSNRHLLSHVLKGMELGFDGESPECDLDALAQ